MLQQREKPFLSRNWIERTHRTIAPYIRRTPALAVQSRDFGLTDFHLALKLEMLQPSGSFKARGAFANLLLRDVPRAGVAAASGGNHGVAVAYAAKTLGVPCSIFVWSETSEIKRARIRSLDAQLHVEGRTYSDALAASKAFSAQSGALQVHAFDAIETMLGTGTIGLEIDDDLSHVDTVIAPVGGGGLVSGIGSWFGADARVIGVEPQAAPTLTRALAAGKPVRAETGSIAEDSLSPDRAGELVIPIAKRCVDRVLLVTDDEIRSAQNALWEVSRIVAEPGGAAAFAALLSGRYVPGAHERVAVILSGGNTAAVSF